MQHRILLTAFFFSLSSIAFTQSDKQVDSLANAMCENFSKIHHYDDSTKVEVLIDRHVPPFIRRLKLRTDEQAEAAFQRVFLRLQKVCPEFQKALLSYQKSDDSNGEWQTVERIVPTQLSQGEIQTFFKGGNFYYMEPGEDKAFEVNVRITADRWTETFPDGTTSQCELKPKGDGTFQLIFIKSDNSIRKSLSRKGDIYYYGVVSFTDNYYSIWNGDPNNLTTPVTIFRLHKRP